MKRNMLSFFGGKSRTITYFKGVFSNFDSRIFLLFALLAVTGGVLYAVKYQNYVDCDEIAFYTDATAYETGALITFRNDTPNAKSWKWDFGDGTVRYMRKNWLLHTYEKPGTYTVTLSVNGDVCTETQIIDIARGDYIPGPRVPKIIAPKTAYVGERVPFNCKYSGDIAYIEWRFEEGIRPDATIQNPEYIYLTPGTKNISLVINGEVQYKATETIIIEPREIIDTADDISTYEYETPPQEYELPAGEPQKDPLEELLENVPAAPTATTTEADEQAVARAPDISEEQFEQLLMEVADKKKTKADFASYFCEISEKVEVIKNEEELINFAELCQLIKGERIKIKTLKLTKNERNCVVNVLIDYKIRKFLGLWWGKD